MINEPQNERTQEWFLMLGDKFATLNRRWVYVLGVCLVLVIPLFYLSRYVFFLSFHSSYIGPQLLNVTSGKESLEIIDKSIFELPQNNYYAVIKLRNPNLEWGVASQAYVVRFKDQADKIVATYSGNTYILPTSTKVLILPRFVSGEKPVTTEIVLADSKFVRPQSTNAQLEVTRKSIVNQNGQMIVSASVRNSTPYTVKQIDLPVTVFDAQNNLIAASTTNVNSVISGETRSFQFVWTKEFNTAVRAEINPEVNLFDRGLFSSELDSDAEVIY
jgi:SLAP domain-containing protein